MTDWKSNNYQSPEIDFVIKEIISLVNFILRRNRHFQLTKIITNFLETKLYSERIIWNQISIFSLIDYGNIKGNPQLLTYKPFTTLKNRIL